MPRMLTTPTLSIITVNYNSGLGLSKTVDSITPFLDDLNAELIIIDGLSTDMSVVNLGEKINLASFFSSEKDLGIYDAMNKGIKNAKGKWIWFLNSGDLALESCKLIYEHTLLDTDEYNFLYCNFETDSGLLINQIYNIRRLMWVMINHQTIIYKKELLDYFDLSYSLGADFAHLLRHYGDIKPKKLNIPIVQYDLNGKSSSFDRSTKMKIWYQRFRAFKNSNLRLDYKLFGMFLSIGVFLLKSIFPKIASRTINLKNRDI